MRTRICHIVDASTTQRLSQRKSGESYRGLALALGYEPGYAATLSKVVREIPGAISHEGENVLRARLGLAHVRQIPVTPCPDCGAIHVGRCHGEPGEVAWLRAGERVTKAKTQRHPAPDLWRYWFAGMALGELYRVPDGDRCYNRKGQLT